jgi:hypothetical protein
MRVRCGASAAVVCDVPYLRALSDLPVQVPTHLLLRLIDFPQLKHSLPNYTPRFVRIRVVADHLGDDHEVENEQSMA